MPTGTHTLGRYGDPNLRNEATFFNCSQKASLGKLGFSWSKEKELSIWVFTLKPKTKQKLHPHWRSYVGESGAGIDLLERHMTGRYSWTS